MECLLTGKIKVFEEKPVLPLRRTTQGKAKNCTKAFTIRRLQLSILTVAWLCKPTNCTVESRLSGLNGTDSWSYYGGSDNAEMGTKQAAN